MRDWNRQIVEYLSNHPEGVDDDKLAIALGMPRRQIANSYCRQLEKNGIVHREPIDGKIRTFLLVSGTPTPSPHSPQSNSCEKPWFWEGNVQCAVAEHLRKCGYQIVRCADTATRQRIPTS